MKFLAFACFLMLYGCNNNKQTPEKNQSDTILTAKADSITKEQTKASGPSADWQEVNHVLSEKFGGSLTIVTDTDANWPKDVFDYFIAPKRKEHPDYPYLCKGDFNGDGQSDAAALVKTKDKPDYQLAIIFGQPLDRHRISFWKEDIDLCAISTFPKGQLEGIGKPAISLKGDAVNVEFYERATFVVYWDGKAFRRTHTGD